MLIERKFFCDIFQILKQILILKDTELNYHFIQAYVLIWIYIYACLSPSIFFKRIFFNCNFSPKFEILSWVYYELQLFKHFTFLINFSRKHNLRLSKNISFRRLYLFYIKSKYFQEEIFLISFFPVSYILV